MKEKDAPLGVTQIWSQWSRHLERVTEADIFRFYEEEVLSSPQLVRFRLGADRWQKVRKWVLSYEKRRPRRRITSS